MKLDLKTMLKGTLACVLLTIGWLFITKQHSVRIDYLAEFELIALWSVVVIGWIVYFIRKLR